MANIELDGANKKIKVDSGDLTLDVPGDIVLDADGADLVFADGGTNLLKVTNSSSDVVLQPQVDAKDIIFKQYDGRNLLEINDGGYVAIANGATGPGQLRLYEDTDNGTNYSAFQVGTQSGDITYTLPTADGSSGQVLSTNGSGTLSWATASSADPSSADGDSLGTASAEWSDLYLADGGVVYFGNDQEITLTHSADSGLLLKHTATADDKPINLVLQTGETDMAADDVIGKISFQAPDEGTGTDAVLVSAAIQAVAEGDHSSSSNATSLQFMTGASEAAAEKMRVSSNGTIAVGHTGSSGSSLTGTGATGVYLSPSATTGASCFASVGDQPLTLNRADDTTNNITLLGLRRQNSVCGTIKGTNTTAQYNTSSDYRLKENVDYTWDATTRFKQLKPARFNWIVDKTNTLVDGFLAHEVTSIVPQAISGEKDAVDSEGNIDPQGIDHSHLVPLLTKALQEAITKIETLETKVKALEDA